MRLSALSGRPLSDPQLRGVVVGAAHAIAEREKLALVHAATDDRSITVTLRSGTVEAVAFLMELRRNTDAWFSEKYESGPLWGTDGHETPPDTDGEM